MRNRNFSGWLRIFIRFAVSFCILFGQISIVILKMVKCRLLIRYNFRTHPVSHPTFWEVRFLKMRFRFHNRDRILHCRAENAGWMLHRESALGFVRMDHRPPAHSGLQSSYRIFYNNLHLKSLYFRILDIPLPYRFHPLQVRCKSYSCTFQNEVFLLKSGRSRGTWSCCLFICVTSKSYHSVDTNASIWRKWG